MLSMKQTSRKGKILWNLQIVMLILLPIGLGVTTALFLPSFPELPIEPVIFLFDMVSPERIPLSVEVCRSQV